MSPALLSPADVADRLGVSVRSARIYMARMRHVRVGRHLRVTMQALDAWIARSTCDASNGSTSVGDSGGLVSETRPAKSDVSRRGARTRAAALFADEWERRAVDPSYRRSAETHRLAHKLRDPKFCTVRTKRAVNSGGVS